MKKLIFTGLIAALLLACAACAGGQALPEEEPPEEPEERLEKSGVAETVPLLAASLVSSSSVRVV